ncbi:MAG: hypothetical protein E6I61_02255 [Chloroflexi bacterium]|nr:MAG: hypothetical protein E6I71_14915 [Chloroflexota bacterium]TME42658.1 MAG: hypothetical protein E6I61_02255 [Chloroflexota bacterium]TME50984.1 MAG: hypothetical protein E6I53_11845 [Chloroflexota bacterium]
MVGKRTYRLAVLLFVALPFFGQSIPAAADLSGGTLFAMSGFGQSVLSTVDPATGAVTTIEDLAGPEQGQLVSITGDPIAHRIYANRQATIFIPPSTILVHQQVLSINSVNGAYTASGPVNVPSGQIAFDPGTGSLYLLGNQGLFKVDPVSGTATAVARLAGGGDILSMAVVPGANRIYLADNQFTFDGVSSQFSYQILSVDTLSGATTSSPGLPGRLGFVVYDSSAGLLMTADAENLFSIDPATGVETAITPIPFNTNPNSLPAFAGAVDPATNTVYLHLQTFDFFNPLDQIISINDQTGDFSLGPNVSAPQLESLYFEPDVTVTPDGIKADVQSALASGAITKAGIAKTLIAELNDAEAARTRGQCKTAGNIYQQFINDLNAQRGKSIAVATASRLVSEAQFLIGNCP